MPDILQTTKITFTQLCSL